MIWSAAFKGPPPWTKSRPRDLGLSIPAIAEAGHPRGVNGCATTAPWRRAAAPPAAEARVHSKRMSTVLPPDQETSVTERGDRRSTIVNHFRILVGLDMLDHPRLAVPEESVPRIHFTARLVERRLTGTTPGSTPRHVPNGGTPGAHRAQDGVLDPIAEDAAAQHEDLDQELSPSLVKQHAKHTSPHRTALVRRLDDK